MESQQQRNSTNNGFLKENLMAYNHILNLLNMLTAMSPQH